MDYKERQVIESITGRKIEELTQKDIAKAKNTIAYGSEMIKQHAHDIDEEIGLSKRVYWILDKLSGNKRS